MPIFGPSVTKSPTIPVDISPAGLNSTLEIFIGPNDTTKVATSGQIPFVSSGNVQQIVAPITMPAEGGAAFHVYVDVDVEGTPLVSLIATEDVIIPSGSIGPVDWT